VDGREVGSSLNANPSKPPFTKGGFYGHKVLPFGKGELEGISYFFNPAFANKSANVPVLIGILFIYEAI
jgi:hypothetical protein